MKTNKRLNTAALITCVVVTVCLLCTCVSFDTAPASSAHTAALGPDELDDTLREAADYLNANVPKGSKVAIISVRSDYPHLSEYIIDGITENLVNDRLFTVVERGQLDAIRAELNFNLSGEVDDNSAQAIGRMVGAQTIIVGTANPLGNNWRLSVRALTVENAEVQGMFSKTIPNGATTAALTSGQGAASTGSTAGGGRSGAATASSPQGSTAQAGPKEGTYTLYPRVRASRSGIPIDMYIARVIVSSDYIVMYLATNPEGEIRIPAIYGGNAPGDFSVQNLDNPAQSYSGVNAVYGGGQATVEAVSFRRFSFTRFKLSITHSEPIVWSEIILNEPDNW